MDKLKYLFEGLRPEVIATLQADEVALYSVSPSWMSRKVIPYLRELGVKTLTDACACVGGDTIAFAPWVDRVTAVEEDGVRAGMLAHNVAAAGLVNVSVRHCDYLECALDLVQDAVYFDPPWGGPGYKASAQIPLSLGGKPLVEVIAAVWGRTKFVLVKAPVNFKMEEFHADAARLMPDCQSCVQDLGRALLIVMRHAPV